MRERLTFPFVLSVATKSQSRSTFRPRVLRLCSYAAEFILSVSRRAQDERSRGKDEPILIFVCEGHNMAKGATNDRREETHAQA